MFGRLVATRISAMRDAALLPLLLILSVSTPCQSGNILILHPLYAGSHVLILKDLGEFLHSRGHSVTQVRFKDRNPFRPPTPKNSNVSEIDLPVVRASKTECGDYINEYGEIDINITATSLLWKQGESVYGIPNDIFCITRAHCHSLLNVHFNKLSKLIQRDNFDLVIVDLIANECGVALGKSLGVPVVGFWMFSYQGGETLRSPVFNPPSIIPSFLSGLPPSRMTFGQRTYNFIVHLTHRALLVIQESIANEFIGQRYPELPSVRYLLADLDFTFIHTNFLVDGPKLIAPNSKYVGGLHLRSPKPLPEDLRVFIEGSEKGAIIFSLGLSGYNPDTVPPFLLRDLLLVFSELKGFRVIMRFDESCIQSSLPENVRMLKWIPQQDLLAHHKVKLFINHGGMGGIQEAVFHGVPMVFIPIFGDQNDNAARLSDFGLGLHIIKSRLNYENLKFAITQVLSDEKYSEQAGRYKALWREEFMSSKEETALVIERLLKYSHLNHLKIQGREYSLFKYFCLDIIIFLSLIFLCITLILGYFIYLLFGRYFFVYDTHTKRKIL